MCVPNVDAGNGENIRYHLFLEMHDSPYYGHRGANATYNAMRTKFYWLKMRDDILKWIKSCPECQNNKVDRRAPKGMLQPVQLPYQPCQSYNMDFMTDLPRSYYGGMWYDTCWVFVDRCSHRTYAILCRKDHTADTLFDLFIHHRRFGEGGCSSGGHVGGGTPWRPAAHRRSSPASGWLGMHSVRTGGGGRSVGDHG